MITFVILKGWQILELFNSTEYKIQYMPNLHNLIDLTKLIFIYRNKAITINVTQHVAHRRSDAQITKKSSCNEAKAYVTSFLLNILNVRNICSVLRNVKSFHRVLSTIKFFSCIYICWCKKGRQKGIWPSKYFDHPECPWYVKNMILMNYVHER